MTEHYYKYKQGDHLYRGGKIVVIRGYATAEDIRTIVWNMDVLKINKILEEKWVYLAGYPASDRTFLVGEGELVPLTEMSEAIYG